VFECWFTYTRIVSKSPIRDLPEYILTPKAIFTYMTISEKL
jgi:hypothetical protein